MRTVGDVVFRRSEISDRGLGLVWLALLVLLLVTWRLAYAPLGNLNLPIAIAIGVVKGALVLWYYMDLRGSPRIVALLFGMSLVMALIGALLTLSDYLTRGD